MNIIDTINIIQFYVEHQLIQWKSIKSLRYGRTIAREMRHTDVDDKGISNMLTGYSNHSQADTNPEIEICNAE